VTVPYIAYIVPVFWSPPGQRQFFKQGGVFSRPTCACPPRRSPEEAKEKTHKKGTNIDDCPLYLPSNGEKKISGILEANDANELLIKLGDETKSFKVECQSWHSYDFDFASLSYAYRFIKNKKGGLHFNILDLDLSPGKKMVQEFIEVQNKWPRFR
jgi:hypothetical protein